MKKYIMRLYASLFSKPALRKINDSILSLALRARGYNNYEDEEQTGEQFFIENILKRANPVVCVDIGANVGEYTEELLKHTTAKVYSFEPLESAFDLLLKRTHIYGDRSVTVNKGVGAENGVLELNYDENCSKYASFSKNINSVPYVNNRSTQSVEVVTLDDFFDQFPVEQIDFIKIDTEGFEGEVIGGAKDIIKKYKPKFIQIECNWHHLFRNMSLYHFSSMLEGYNVYQLIPGGWIERSPLDPLNNIYHFSIYVFVSNDLSPLGPL